MFFLPSCSLASCSRRCARFGAEASAASSRPGSSASTSIVSTNNARAQIPSCAGSRRFSTSAVTCGPPPCDYSRTFSTSTSSEPVPHPPPDSGSRSSTSPANAMCSQSPMLHLASPMLGRGGGLLKFSAPLFYPRRSHEFVRMKKRMQGAKWQRWWARANNEKLIREKTKDPLKKEQFLEFSKANSWPRHLRDNRMPAKIDLAFYMNIEQGDLVQVLYGRDAGKQGVVRRVLRKKNCLLVHGMNMKKTFRVDTKVGETLVTTEMPIHVTNVAPVDPILKKPTRVKKRYTMHGECVRISKVSGCAMPDPVFVQREEREELFKKWQFQKSLKKSMRGVANQLVDKRHYQMLAKGVAV
ncbi:unnamed protein product [Amoebophrya sp. A25]|nr:unnamed protein product [Amoebophrya sp. A25]|eukprot:GSA25T00003589001.1